MYAHIVTVDAYGNRLEQVSDPIHVDSPLTPDIIEPIDSYHGRMDSSCTELGVNHCIEDHALSTADGVTRTLSIYGLDGVGNRTTKRSV